jgi:alpha-tubulin suppressor-like RCC1 family protein
MAVKFKFPYEGTTVTFDDYYMRFDVFATGRLWCWGKNSSGQLGDNSITHRSSPVQTVAYGGNWKEISSGRDFTVAIKDDGTLWTWGENASGQLADNTNTDRSSPIQTVSAGATWKTCSAGNYHAAAVKTDGSLWLWGLNSNGELGDNTIVHRSSPVQTVGAAYTWLQVSCGNAFTAALKTDGTLWAWGSGSSGVLGNNAVTQRSSPVQTIAFGTTWRYVSAGLDHTIALKTDNSLWCWGSNALGQLGDNTITSRSSPVQTITYATNWKNAHSGYSNTFAVKTDGTLWVWGRNGNGQLGDNSITHRSSPVQTISFGNNWRNVNGGTQTLALKIDGSLWSWGTNTDGQLGNNGTTDRSSPVQVLNYSYEWKQISSKWLSNCGAINYTNYPSNM